ncbi:MAG: alpha/beta fold hydrolase [Alphaproteobacteria bacterium]|nr:alpha/beta fold hydrolase [Alphaproteobacteria bacterium]
MRTFCIPLVLALASCKAGTKLDPRTPYAVQRDDVTVTLAEGLETAAEVTFPDHGKGPHPTVLLLHGSGPQDMDATLEGPVGTTRLFADLSNALSARGFAVIRYDKRHVTGPGKFDLPAFIGDQSTFTFEEDAKRVLDALSTHPRVDPNRIFVYGWSEGTVVAAKLATERPNLAGVVFQGPVGMTFQENFRTWFDLAVPYLQRFSPRDDRLDGAELGLALRSAASQPVHITSAMLAVSYTRASDVARPSPLVDTDRDGQIDIQTELIPKIDGLVDLAFGPIGAFVSYADGNTLPPVTAQVPQLTGVPVLVLQGMQDAHTPPENADRIEAALQAAGHPDYAIERIEGAGHTLGRASDPIDDLGRPMSAATVDRIVGWLVEHAK